MKIMIKKRSIIRILTILLVTIGVYSCDDFLDKPPLTDFTDGNYWSFEDNVRTFAWGLYNGYYGYGRGGTQYAEFYWQQEGNQSYEMMFSEDLLHSTFLGFPKGAYTTNAMWGMYFENIRKTNLMLARIPDVDMSEAAKDHWTGVSQFFRAHYNFSLLSSWGGVPIVLDYYSPDDKEHVYVPRSDRTAVAEHIINDLKDAIRLMKEDDGIGAVNKYSAYALLARAALFEGTFMKYHNVSGDYN